MIKLELNGHDASSYYTEKRFIMKSFFQNSIYLSRPGSVLYLIISAFIFTIVTFVDYHYGWELKRGFGVIISAILAQIIIQIVIINSKLDDILESRKTDNYHGGGFDVHYSDNRKEGDL